MVESEVVSLDRRTASDETATEPLEWNYDITDTVHGPYHWNFKRDWVSCSKGQRQSPINIVDVKKDSTLKALLFNYQSHVVSMTNTGRNIRMDFAEGSHLVDSAGDSHDLKYLVFHSPSEHRIRGIVFPLEMQLVHQSTTTGRLTIVSTLFTEGQANPVLRFLSAVPRTPSEDNPTVLHDTYFNPENLLPAGRAYFTYEGSLTAPPCNEGVVHYVMQDYSDLGASQVGILRSVFGGVGNARPVQNWNGRVVRGTISPLPPNNKDNLAASSSSSSSSKGSGAVVSAPHEPAGAASHEAPTTGGAAHH